MPVYQSSNAGFVAANSLGLGPPRDDISLLRDVWSLVLQESSAWPISLIVADVMWVSLLTDCKELVGAYLVAMSKCHARWGDDLAISGVLGRGSSGQQPL